jgi:hypothetical protein
MGSSSAKSEPLSFGSKKLEPGDSIFVLFEGEPRLSSILLANQERMRSAHGVKPGPGSVSFALCKFHGFQGDGSSYMIMCSEKPIFPNPFRAPSRPLI